MKKITLLLLFFCFQSQAQFMHLKVNQESGPVKITFMDGTVLSGVAKNNKADDFMLRGLSMQNDRNAMKNANIVAETIQFKEEGTDEFKVFNSNQIKKVNFIYTDGTLYWEYFRIEVAKLDLDTFETKKSVSMFLTKLRDGHFQTYGYAFYNSGLYMYTYAFVKVIGEDYTVSLTQNTLLHSDTKIFKVLDYVGKDCPAYQKYMKAVDAKGDLIFRKEYKEAFKAFKESMKERLAKYSKAERHIKIQETVAFNKMKDLYYIDFLEGKYGELCQ